MLIQLLRRAGASIVTAVEPLSVRQRLAEAVGADFTPSLAYPYRWQDWAAPDGQKRVELQLAPLGAFFAFVNGDLIPHLRGLRNQPDATPRQKVISEIMSGVEKTRVDTERNFLDVLDRVHALSATNIDDTHIFPLSQVYEGLLLKMQDGREGQRRRAVLHAARGDPGDRPRR